MCLTIVSCGTAVLKGLGKPISFARAHMSTGRIDTYQSKGNTSSRWVSRAESLLASAAILSEKTSILDRNAKHETAPAQDSIDARVFPVALMLRAMALECLLKSLWLQAGKVLFDNGKYRPVPDTKPHNLEQLFAVVSPLHSLSASAAEQSILERLTLFNARGRYPSQVNWQINTPRQTAHGKIPPTHWQPYYDEPSFESLLAKINACVLKP